MSHAETQTSKAKDAIAGASKPRSRGDKRRARILLAFHDCILDKGYARTTLRDVSRKADISASHLLYYFSGKDAILEQYFENVGKRIKERLDSFRTEQPVRQIELLTDLFFAGKGITRSEIGFMLECFGVAVHDKRLRKDKKKLDRYCKAYLTQLFDQLPAGPGKSEAHAELAYALLIGLRTAAYFDKRLQLGTARQLFNEEMMNLAGIRERD